MQNRHYSFQIFIFSLIVISNTGFSHDFWLEAHPFYTMPKKSVDISVHVGNQFIGDSLPNIVSWYSDFSLYQSDSKSEIKGELGRDPAGYFIPEQTGTYAIGYQNTFSYIEIDPDTFNQYLKEEGLHNAILFRQENNLSKNIGKEKYIRHAKTLVQSGKSFSVDYSTVNFGYELEIIPLSNPYHKKVPDTLNVKVLYKNRPLKNSQLSAYSMANPVQIQTVQTNQNGVASITLDQSGPWLVKVVKILSIEDDKANWQSHWASLTFEIKTQSHN